MRYACAMLIPILDPDDTRIEPYRAVRERDLVGRQDRFIVEGDVVLRVFLTRARSAAESLLIADNRIESLADVIASLPETLPIYTAGRKVMDAIVGFPIHRGILALGRRPDALAPGELLSRLPEEALVIGLVGLANHDNVGGVFRNAAAFGADAVLLDPGTCNPLYRKAIRVSVGGCLTVPFARATSPDGLLEALADAGFHVIALSPSAGESLADVRRRPRTALLLGAEGSGLPPDLLAHIRGVSIPMRGGFDSLNVATTSGIALYHLVTGQNASIVSQGVPAGL
jgi:tRNA G18 (ribose-2'-O)-methylase SpoU